MGIYGGTNFKEATQAKTPDFSLAMARQGQLNDAEKARVNSLRSKNMMGAAKLYNEGMGENSPIADQFQDWMGVGEAAPAGDVGLATNATDTVNALREGANVTQGIGVETGMQTAAQIAAEKQLMAEIAAEQLAAQTAAAGGTAAASGAGTAGAAGSAASTGPWGMILAAAMMNENAAHASGRRDEDAGSYRTDLASGAVLEQDMDALGDKIGGAGGEIISTIGQTSNPEGALNVVKDFGENIKQNPLDPFKMWS